MMATLVETFKPITPLALCGVVTPKRDIVLFISRHAMSIATAVAAVCK